MPGFKDGKYAKYNPYLQFADSNTRTIDLLEDIGNTDLKNKLMQFSGKLSQKTNGKRNVTVIPDDQAVNTESGFAIKNYIDVPALDDEAKENLNELHAYLGNFLAHHDKKYDPYIGFIKQAHVMSDTEGGSYTEAVYDNPYLFGIQNMTANGLKLGQFNGPENFANAFSDQTDPVTKEKEPLGYINSWFANSADLYSMELKKQALTAREHTPEKEAAYLAELNKVFTATLDNFDRFYAFAKKAVNPKTGESKYDQYLNNHLDMFTGVSYSVSASSRRSPRLCYSWIRGQQQAIKNGWGMNELNVLGSIYAMADSMEDDYHRFENDFGPEGIQKKISEAERAIEKANTKLTTLQTRHSNEKNADRKREIGEQIVQWKKTIDDNNKIISDARRDSEQYEEKKTYFKNQLERINTLKNELGETVVKNPSDKYIVSSKINNYIKAFDAEEHPVPLAVFEDTKKQAENHLTAILPTLEAPHKSRNAELLASRKTAELPEDLLDAKDIQSENGLFTLRRGTFSMIRGKFLGDDQPDFNAEIGRKYKIEIEDERNGLVQKLSELEGMINTRSDIRFDVAPPQKYSSAAYQSDGSGIKLNLESLEGENSKWEEIADLAHSKWTEQNMKLNKTDAVFKPYNDTLGIGFDTKKGSLLQAYDENFISRGLFASCGDGPGIHRANAENAHPIPHETVKKTLDENGVTVPLMSFYAGVGEVAEAEYYKQNAEKTGWNKAKEKIYFSKLQKAYDRVLNAHAELVKLPDNIQNDGSAMDNTLGDITGVGGIYNRSSYPYMDAMRWSKQAMLNGWNKDNIVVMTALGHLEGQINLLLYQLDHEINVNPQKHTNSLQNMKNLLPELTRFKNNEFAAFKEEILNKKINSPADVIEVLNKIDKFKKDNENNPALNPQGIGFYEGHILNDALDTFKYSLDIVNNNAIKELGDIVEAEKVPGTTVLPELTADEQKQISLLSKMAAVSKTNAKNADLLLSGISNAPLLEYDTALQLASEYFKNRYLGTICAEEHPELFEKKNFNYRKATKKLANEADKFARTFLDEMYPPVAGDNAPGQRQIKGDELAGSLAFGGIDAHFRDVTKKIEAGMRRENMNIFVDGSMTNIQRDASGKIISQERLRINDNLKRTCNRLEAANKNINMLFTSDLYLEISNHMNKLYKEKLAIDKKIKAAQDAAKNKPGEEYSDKPVKIDQKAFDKFKLKVNTLHGYLDKYIEGKEEKIRMGKSLNKYEKQHFEAAKDARNAVLAIKYQLFYFGNNGPSNLDAKQEELNYNVDKETIMGNVNINKIYTHNKMVELKDTIKDMNAKEAQNRSNLAKNANNNKAEIIRSAERELYLEAISSALGKESNTNILKNAENNNQLKKVVSDLEAGKGSSADLDRFRNKCFSSKSFKDEFESKVMASVKAGKWSHQDILKCRDDALKSAIQKNMANTAEVTKLEDIKKLTGSGAEPVMIRHNPVAVNHPGNQAENHAGNHNPGHVAGK